MSDPYIGEIRMFAGNFAPLGWNFCDGSLQSIANYQALFQLIGTTYGGDGVTNFALPDLRGRVPIHQGQGVGLSPYVIGQVGGTEQVTLTSAQMPAHSHPANANSGAGDQAAPAGNAWAATSTTNKAYSTVAPNVTLRASSIGPTGGNQPHENVMPCLTVSFIIALNGIFPSQT